MRTSRSSLCSRIFNSNPFPPSTQVRRVPCAKGQSYPHLFALRPNTGLQTGLDLNGNGRTGEPQDAQGFGSFSGQAGLAILSRFPVERDRVRDFSRMFWRDMPPLSEDAEASAYTPPATLRLSSVAHWDVPVTLPDGPQLHMLVWHGSTPVFDGPEDRNGRRGAGETLFWTDYLDGRLPFAPPEDPVIVVGVANIDPMDGEGRHDAARALLSHPRLQQDPKPRSMAGTRAALRQGAVNAGHRGDPALDTADWPDGPGQAGNLRVSYILPDRALRAVQAGVFWPQRGALAEHVIRASRHRLLWVDLSVSGSD